MMGEELNIDDQEVLDKFEKIDWIRLGMDDARTFGLGVTFYREALDAHLRVQSNAKETTYGFVGMSAIIIVCSLLHLGMGAMLSAIVVLKSMSLAYAWFRERAAAGAVKVQLESLKDDLSKLEAKFPAPGLETDEMTFEDDNDDEDLIETEPPPPLV